MTTHLVLLSALLAISAQAQAVRVGFLKPLSLLGGNAWGEDAYFDLRWSQRAEAGLLDLRVLDEDKTTWMFDEMPYGEHRATLVAFDPAGAQKAKLEVDVSRAARAWVLPGAGKTHAVVANDAGTLFGVGKDGARLWDFRVESMRPESFALLRRKRKAALLVAAYGYGEAALRAVDEKGALAWVYQEIERANSLGGARLDGEDMVWASNGTGRFAFVDSRGKTRERLQAEGNSDRLLVAGPSGRETAFAIDSGAGSRRERLWVYQREKAGVWKKLTSADLGPVTVTAWTVGDFDGDGSSEPVVGTDNGWIFVLDGAGRTVSETRHRGKVFRLAAADLDGDGRSELVAGVLGSTTNVLVYGRPKR